MIFIDTMDADFRGMKMSHMWTDGTIDELHKFAQKLGLKRSWFQDKSTLRHYDVSLGKKKQAIKMGAVLLKYGFLEWVRCST